MQTMDCSDMSIVERYFFVSGVYGVDVKHALKYHPKWKEEIESMEKSGKLVKIGKITYHEVFAKFIGDVGLFSIDDISTAF